MSSFILKKFSYIILRSTHRLTEHNHIYDVNLENEYTGIIFTIITHLIELSKKNFVK
jgi:hypothetical protein